ncbi:hypothetical protein [Spirochaeta lutea]|uniref:Uncharacterized protein n=1 Tax=Spirochaeta lutea TaxID=1480694 RepID=A0A098R1I6_9SPIO|nr:hypothetical protein [Spirochaeta lutea]KGE73651.1 hypothetical protein DC28_03185 [Spirochaeta lutea]
MTQIRQVVLTFFYSFSSVAGMTHIRLVVGICALLGTGLFTPGTAQDWRVMSDEVFTGQVVGQPILVGDSLYVLTGDRQLHRFFQTPGEWNLDEPIALPRRGAGLMKLNSQLALLELSDRTWYLVGNRGVISQRRSGEPGTNWREFHQDLDEDPANPVDGETLEEVLGSAELPLDVRGNIIGYQINKQILAVIHRGWRIILLQNGPRGMVPGKIPGTSQGMGASVDRRSTGWRYLESLIQEDPSGEAVLRTIVTRGQEADAGRIDMQRFVDLALPVFWYGIVSGSPGLDSSARLEVLGELLRRADWRTVEGLVNMVAYEYDFIVFIRLLEELSRDWWPLIALYQESFTERLHSFVAQGIRNENLSLDSEIRSIVGVYGIMRSKLAAQVLNRLFPREFWELSIMVARLNSTRRMVMER